MKYKKIPNVLVLNKSYVAIHQVDWKRAISLIYQETAYPMDRNYDIYRTFDEWIDFSIKNYDQYPYVNTVKYKIVIPEIILLSNYNKLPMREIKFNRPSVFMRDKYKCAYCGNIFPKEKLNIDHIIPKDKGGLTTWDNIVTSCIDCNNKKGNRTPEGAGMKLLYKPKKPKWISPIGEISSDHPCKSWRLFLDRARVDIGD